MKLHVGPPPEDPSFQPERDGWTPLREPSPAMLNVVATPACVGLGVATAALWGDVSFAGPALPVGASKEILLAAAVAIAVAGFALLVVAHELVHGLTYPGFGTKVRVVLGAWPSKLLFYAATLDAVPRDRLLAVYFAPLIVLSGGPLLADKLLGLDSLPLMLVSVVNAFCSGGDLTVALLIVWQTPRDALVRNRGWATYWKRITPDRPVATS